MACRTDITWSLRIVSALKSMMATRPPQAGGAPSAGKSAELAIAT
jgi:hypothetical protein